MLLSSIYCFCWVTENIPFSAPRLRVRVLLLMTVVYCGIFPLVLIGLLIGLLNLLVLIRGKDPISVLVWKSFCRHYLILIKEVYR